MGCIHCGENASWPGVEIRVENRHDLYPVACNRPFVVKLKSWEDDHAGR